MRKSKVIVPAIALLTLSMSAAITSTVAWFTYVRDVDLTGDKLTVINSNGDLKVTVGEDLIGCTSTGTEEAPKIEFGKFRDGSVDMANIDGGTDNAIAYFPQIVDKQGNPSRYVGLKSSREYKERDVYLANKFNLTFSLSRSLESDHLLFFDTATSISKTAGLNSTEDAVRNALRFGFRIKDSNNSFDGQGEPVSRTNAWFVWAPFATLEAAGENGHYVGKARSGSPETIAQQTYLATDIADPAALADTYTETEAEKTARTKSNYLGTFKEGTNGSDVQEISLDVYVWFEGSDPSCKTASIETVDPTWKVSLNFSTKIGILNSDNHDVENQE